jgi:hypothetical protein
MGFGGMSMKTVNITQCDLRRTIQINDQLRKYMITPMDTDESADTSSTPAAHPTPQTGPSASQRGGIVTYTVNTVDTGERKEMFGFNARHLKSTMTSESSPDACQQQQIKMERDGWYINLQYGLNCGRERPPQQMGRMAPRGCRDQFRFHHTGPTNLGFPLIETMTMYGPDGNATFTITREVTELSRQPLDAALFDIPNGYTEAHSPQEIYAAPSIGDIMKMANRQQQQPSNEGNPSAMAGMPSAASEGKSGSIRIGVGQINNKTGASVSTDELRDKLVSDISASGVEAIPLNAISQSEAEAEAQAKQCNYILYTDISSLKAASAKKKFGSILGQATGIPTGGGGGKSEARFDFRLFSTGSSSATLESSAVGKEDSQDASVGAALEREAKAVVAAAGKR